MIEFVFSREKEARSEYVIEKMKEALAKGQRALLIIPENQALEWDRVCALRFEKRDALNIDTLSFTRLSDSVFRVYGGCAKNYISRAEKALLMWSAVNTVRGELSVYKNADSRYLDLLSQAISEFKLYGVSQEELLVLSEELSGEGGSLSLRLRDIALIYGAYQALLEGAFDDPEETMDALSECLSENNYFENTAVFIDSFNTLTPKEIKVVREIFRGAESTLVTFPYIMAEKDMPHITHIHDYMKRLGRIVSSLGLELAIKELSAPSKREFALIKSDLWDFSAEAYDEKTDRISFIKCADRYDEAILAGARIKELLAGGARYSEIALVAANFDILRGICDTELEKQGIPIYVAGRTPILSQAAMRLVFSVLNVLSYGWRREDIIASHKTGLCAISADEADAFEVYTDKWQIKGKRLFSSDRDWDMNPHGYSEEISDWGEKLLILANSAKNKIVPPIEAYGEAFPTTMRNAAAATYRLLCDFQVYSQLQDEVKRLSEAGEMAKAQEKSQVWGAIMELLDCAASTIPDEIVDAKRFASLLSKIAETLSIGTIPDGIDRVALANAESVHLDNIKHIIILGAKSGEFPKVIKEEGVFGDMDREILRSHGIELSKGTQAARLEELFRFSNIASAPTETLTVMIPQSGELYSPSLGALRLMKLFPRARMWDFTTPDGERVIRKYSCSTEEGYSLPFSACEESVEGEALKGLYDKDLSLTQSRIECFTSCAFKYYCENVLRLDDAKKAEVNPADVGTFIHWVLEHFMKEAAEEGFPLSEDSIKEKESRLIGEYREKAAPKESGGFVDHIFERLEKSIDLFLHSLNEEFAQSKFAPFSFELPVGFSDELPAVPIPLSNGHSLRLRGIADRVDVYKEGDNVYIRVADYKTGAKTFSLANVKKGKNFQLLLYLFSICNMPRDCSYYKSLAPNNEKLLPAGAVYFSARPGDIQSESLLSDDRASDFALDSISRTGIVLGEKEIISAMDKDMKGRFAPATFDEKKGIRGTVASSKTDFDQIETELNEFFKIVGDRITSGEAAALPEGVGQNSTCSFCSMKPFCRYCTEADKRNREGVGDDE